MSLRVKQSSLYQFRGQHHSQPGTILSQIRGYPSRGIGVGLLDCLQWRCGSPTGKPNLPAPNQLPGRGNLLQKRVRSVQHAVACQHYFPHGLEVMSSYQGYWGNTLAFGQKLYGRCLPPLPLARMKLTTLNCRYGMRRKT